MLRLKVVKYKVNDVYFISSLSQDFITHSRVEELEAKRTNVYDIEVASILLQLDYFLRNEMRVPAATKRDDVLEEHFVGAGGWREVKAAESAVPLEGSKLALPTLRCGIIGCRRGFEDGLESSIRR